MDVHLRVEIQKPRELARLIKDCDLNIETYSCNHTYVQSGYSRTRNAGNRRIPPRTEHPKDKII